MTFDGFVGIDLNKEGITTLQLRPGLHAQEELELT